MNLEQAIEEAKKNTKKRNFNQSLDLIISLREFDVKRMEKIEDFVQLPKDKVKKNKICAIVGPELKDQANKTVDKVILAGDLQNWSDKRKNKKLAREFDFFIAQAEIMPQIAQVFGRYFGPLNKMPNPKSGSVVPKSINLNPLVTRLQNTIKIIISKTPVVQCSIGTESMNSSDLTNNAEAVLNALEHKLPRGKQNIGKVIIKTTMGKPAKVEW